MNFLETENVVKQYAGHLALNKVSIQVPQGTIFGLLGPNGAGKTTLIRIINRITAPDSGIVRFNGHESSPEDESRGAGDLSGTIERSLLPRGTQSFDPLVREI